MQAADVRFTARVFMGHDMVFAIFPISSSSVQLGQDLYSAADCRVAIQVMSATYPRLEDRRATRSHFCDKHRVCIATIIRELTSM